MEQRTKATKGELVFVTARECRDVTPEEASSCILGYTIGNDLSCRFFQLPEQTGGQFFYAKAFDKFAPIGPALIHDNVFTKFKKTARLMTRINGEVKQDTRIEDDMIYDPAKVLSWMSQSKSDFRKFSSASSDRDFRHNHTGVYSRDDRDPRWRWRLSKPKTVPAKWGYRRG